MKADSGEEASHGKLFLPALVVSNFATGPISVWAALLLVEIGKAFNTDVGVTGQINTPYSFAAFVVALLMSVLSIRFRHKSLLLTGLVLMSLSAVGCFLAPDFMTMLMFYSLSGVGYAMISPMLFTLTGENYPLEKRARAIGWIVAGGALVYVIGAPLIALMAGSEGWRFPLLAFVFPVLLMSALLTFVGLPSASKNHEVSSVAKSYLAGFRDILFNKSAVACLTGNVLRSAAFVAIVLYSASFFEKRFSLSTELAALVLLGGALCYALGSLISSLLVNRFGRKSSAVLTALLSGAFTISYVLAPSLWLSLILVLVASWFFGMVASAANSLTLEQVPAFKGTMMSVDTAVINVGSALGTAVGGIMWLYFDYEGLGSVLGVMGIVAALVFWLLARDPSGLR